MRDSVHAPTNTDRPSGGTTEPRPTGAVVCIVLAVAVLLLKRRFQGPYAELVHSYLGNLSVSFAVYFLATIATARLGGPRLAAAVSALIVVEAFELTNGFGVMSNVYDPWDLLANAAGVAFALGLDLCRGSRPFSIRQASDKK